MPQTTIPSAQTIVKTVLTTANKVVTIPRYPSAMELARADMALGYEADGTTHVLKDRYR